MKTYILTLLAVFFLSIATIAQNFTITVNGTVMVVTNNNMTPVADQPVIITIDSVGFGFTYVNTVYTDESGYYEDIVSIPGYSGYGYVSAQTYDSCLGYNLYLGQFIAQGGLQPMDFFLCNTVTPECQAYFYYYQANPEDPYTIAFENMSVGDYTQILWDFGDSTYSAEMFPVHTYAGPGTYYVCLTISGTDCSNTYCEFVNAGGGSNGCESFIIPLSMYGLTVDFEGYTVSPFETEYTWEFGDGVTGTGQYISHTFPSPGMYDVTLQTMDANGCYFQTFTQIWLDSTNQGGCSAYFGYEQADSNTFTFNGVIYFNNGIIYPDSSTVYSWDFGDGTFGTGQTVTHYFQENPAGGYTVCLTATAVLPDGSACTAVYCEFINLVVPGFNIFGYVYLENNMVADQAVVHLMTMDTLWQGVVEVQSTTVDSGGFYDFPNISFYNSRVYYVQAELTEGSEYYGEYLPTYHVSALSWEQAAPILPLMNWTADVFMIPATTFNGGNGEISGTVTNLGTRGYMDNVEVVLLDAGLNPLTYLRSDEQGMFAFSDLALGTYVIHAELMGIHTIQAQVTLSEQNPSASVEVQVNGNEANIVFGIPEKPVSISRISDIYPNPVKGLANIEITMSNPAALSVRVIGITGQQVMANSYSLPAGTHRVEINAESLPEGIYLLQLVTENGETVSRKFIIR